MKKFVKFEFSIYAVACLGRPSALCSSSMLRSTRDAHSFTPGHNWNAANQWSEPSCIVPITAAAVIIEADRGWQLGLIDVTDGRTDGQTRSTPQAPVNTRYVANRPFDNSYMVRQNSRNLSTFKHRWLVTLDSFYSAPQCSHCKRCTSYGNSVRLSVCPSVWHTPVLCQNDCT